MEDHTTGPESAGLEPEKGAEQDSEFDAAARLKELEEEAERLRRQIRAEQEAKEEEPPEEDAVEIPSPVSEESAVAEPPLVEPDPVVHSSPEDQARAEELLRQAHVAEMRGNAKEREALLAEAEKIAPDFPPVLEALGDALVARSKWKDAQAVYGRACKLDKSNVALERKYAQAVLKASVPVEAMLMGGGSVYEDVASAKAAAVWSLFFPGVGQIVMGEVLKGVAFLAVWLLCCASALLIPDGLSGFIGLAGGRSESPNMLVLVPIFVGIVTWLLAVTDANSKVKTIAKKPVDRPKPPVDLPFE